MRCAAQIWLDLRTSSNSVLYACKFYRRIESLAIEAVSILAKYDTLKDHNGDTRRERNERFNADSPQIQVLSAHPTLLEWFIDLSSTRSWGMQGPNRISYAEMLSWIIVTGVHITRKEVRSLHKMDVAWCAAISVESEAIETRRAAESG